MPIYEYRCENGHTFEVMLSMSDDPVTACEECGAPVERVFHPIAVHFKGSGFYNTDYKDKGKEGAAKDGASDGGSESKSKSESSDSSGSSEKSDSGSGEKKSDSKSDSKTPASSSSD